MWLICRLGDQNNNLKFNTAVEKELFFSCEFYKGTHKDSSSSNRVDKKVERMFFATDGYLKFQNEGQG